MLWLVPVPSFPPNSNVQKGDHKEFGLKVEQEMELNPGSRGCRTQRDGGSGVGFMTHTGLPRQDVAQLRAR